MASYGSGFAQGMMAGSAVAQRGMDNYNKRQDEETRGRLFQAAYGGVDQAQQALEAEGQALSQAGQQRQGIFNMIGNASQGDITKAIVDNYVSAGGKINDKTYELAAGVAGTLFGAVQQEKDYQNKNMLFQKKMQNYESQMNRRSILNQRGEQGTQEKRTRLMQNADYIRDKYGDEAAQKYISSNWKAKEFNMGDETVATEEAPAPKASWKDYLK